MGFEWQFSTPGVEGMDSDVLNQVDTYIKQKRYRLVDSVLVVKNGRIVFEKYYNKCDENSKHHIKSVWKSFLSTVLGICIDKGIIEDIDTPISKYLPEFARNTHQYHKLITIRHLLTMSSGIYWNGGVHYHCPMVQQMYRTGNWLDFISDVAMAELPGTKHDYKEFDVILLAAVIGKAFGSNAYEAAKELLYDPMEIDCYPWDISPCGVAYPFVNADEEKSGGALKARDMAKLGMLFMNKGFWDGKQIISEKYITQALTPFHNNIAYGFLWWLYEDGYGCRGYGGQEVNVVPDKSFVSVIQATATSSNKHYSDINKSILKKAII